MINKSKELWIVALFLSKYGQIINNNTLPPKELKTEKWVEAYRMFYDKLGGGRNVRSFENTFKHTRDDFDSHLPNTLRVGWKSTKGKPKKLSRTASDVFLTYGTKSRDVFWKEIRQYAALDVEDYSQEFEDLASMQDSETELILPQQKFNSRTEGGKKVIISYKIERSPKLKKQALMFHGYDCMVCGFNFEKEYGEWGKGFAEVHHLIPLSNDDGRKRETNFKTDLAVLCANCHRMVHRKKHITLAISELKEKIKNK